MIGRSPYDPLEVGRFAQRRMGLPAAFADSPSALGAAPQGPPAPSPDELDERATMLRNQFGPGANDLPPAPPPAAMPQPSMQPPSQQPDPAAVGAFAQQRMSAADPNKQGANFFDGSQPQPIPRADNPDKGLQIADAIASGLAGRGYDAQFWQGKQAERQLAAERDPSSQQSAMARKSVAPMLRQLGMSPDDVAQMSAADVKAMGSPGALMKFIAQQRVEVAKSTAANTEWDRRNAVTAPQALERAQTLAGTQFGNQQQMALSNDALERVRQAEQSGRSLTNSRTLAEEADARRVADEKRKESEKVAAAQAGFVQPEEIEASNQHIKVTNPNLLSQTQSTSRRSAADIRNDIKTGERAAHMYDQMVADEAEWSRASLADKSQALAGVPLTDAAKKLATIKARYDSFSTELQGIKTKIAQSAGSAAEREDSKHDIPSIMSPDARQRLAGIGGMLESNANANLGATGLTIGFVNGPPKHGGGELGVTHGAGPKASAAVGKPAAKAAGKKGGHVRAPDGSIGVIDDDLTPSELEEMRAAGYTVVE